MPIAFVRMNEPENGIISIEIGNKQKPLTEEGVQGLQQGFGVWMGQIVGNPLLEGIVRNVCNSNNQIAFNVFALNRRQFLCDGQPNRRQLVKHYPQTKKSVAIND